MWTVLFATASEEWGGDEILLLLVSAVVTLSGLHSGWQALHASSPLRRRPLSAALVVAAAIAAFAFLLYVTWHWTAREIRHGQPYAWLVMLMGTAWLTICTGLFSWFGVSFRDDACERRNPAAGWALAGALPGAACLYAGASSGEGPSFWNNVFTVAVGGAAWFGAWLALELTTRCSRAITEDRDPASGLRLGAFLLAQGLIVGRALAGDWESPAAVLSDLLRDSWPAASLLAVAIASERVLQPSPRNPHPSVLTRALPLAFAFLLIAFTWLIHLGWWPGAPR